MNRRPLLRSIAGASIASALAGCTSSLENRLSDPGSIDDRDPAPLTDGTNAWPSEGFDAANTGYNPDAELLEAELAATRLTRDGAGIDTAFGGGGVAVVDDRCYFGTGSGDVVCRSSPGEYRWKYEADPAAGVRSIPSLSRDVVYVSSDNGTYALGADDGEELWTNDDAFVRYGSSVLTTDHLYAIGGGGVLALDVETGARNWSADAPHPHALAVADGTAYTASSSSSGGTAALADGETVWTRDDLDDHRAPPVVADDVVLVCDGDGRLEALDREDGSTGWSYDRRGSGGVTPTVAHGQVYLPSGNGPRTVCLDLGSGEELWDLSTGLTRGQPVAVADGVYVGTPNEGLFAVESDGAVRWHDEELRVDGNMAAVGDTLYAVAFGGPFGSGDLYALETADEA
ncbi:PQQ-binding-like beta-propeller repeat protein [Natronococcus sp. A-GB1]|uniref:outer membrane protein assembly factor BamB family protein n=1 Tax=Natronococcus sp. A-GB1 TaxID=3037648 RepID=UPI00241EB807|nr:PQQ-binding-like beta-propeller repeat protein [Natronococcus sp. A-GB1]MDG5758666.1 PQQ-binding-like beta-propeller repeat protein [Natronococcus sp. A-GB1]